jgi:hypothetical protein
MDIKTALNDTLSNATTLAKMFGAATMTFTKFTTNGGDLGVWGMRPYEKMVNVIMTPDAQENHQRMGERLAKDWIPMGIWHIHHGIVIYRSSWPFTAESFGDFLTQHLSSLDLKLGEELSDDENGNHRRNLR